MPWLLGSPGLGLNKIIKGKFQENYFSTIQTWRLELAIFVTPALPPGSELQHAVLVAPAPLALRTDISRSDPPAK